MSLSVDTVDIKKKIDNCKTLKELEVVRLEYLGKKGLLPSEMKLLGRLPIDQKKVKGQELNKLKTFIEVSINDKKILIESSKKIFAAGDLIKFNGTGIPNNSMELILENNLGDEMASEIFELDDSGFVNFEYQTIENDDNEGTWTLIASQKETSLNTYQEYNKHFERNETLEFEIVNFEAL